MAISSFNKDFTLKSKREVDSFLKIINSSSPGTKIDRNLVSPEKMKAGELKLTQVLSRCK